MLEELAIAAARNGDKDWIQSNGVFILSVYDLQFVDRKGYIAIRHPGGTEGLIVGGHIDMMAHVDGIIFERVDIWQVQQVKMLFCDDFDLYLRILNRVTVPSLGYLRYDRKDP